MIDQVGAVNAQMRARCARYYAIILSLTWSKNIFKLDDGLLCSHKMAPIHLAIHPPCAPLLPKGDGSNVLYVHAWAMQTD